jgi:hypothetical protein
MRRNNSQSNFRRVVAMAMGLAALGMGTPNASANAIQSNNATQQQSRKDAIQEKHIPVRPVSRKSDFHGAGDANPFKHIRTPKSNQRQLRKLWRQCPHSRKKYK